MGSSWENLTIQLGLEVLKSHIQDIVGAKKTNWVFIMCSISVGDAPKKIKTKYANYFMTASNALCCLLKYELFLSSISNLTIQNQKNKLQLFAFIKTTALYHINKFHINWSIISSTSSLNIPMASFPLLGLDVDQLFILLWQFFCKVRDLLNVSPISNNF